MYYNTHSRYTEPRKLLMLNPRFVGYLMTYDQYWQLFCTVRTTYNSLAQKVYHNVPETNVKRTQSHSIKVKMFSRVASLYVLVLCNRRRNRTSYYAHYAL